MPSISEPLVSICVPTYNRVHMLSRALESGLAQSYGNIEVLVSDNASTDGTEDLCRELAREDPRLRYLRQTRNLGPTANFNVLIDCFRGQYVMMLADDDWLDADYVAACLDEHRRDPDLALVAGWARYLRDGEVVGDGVPIQLEEETGSSRVRSYYRAVKDNGTFYGVMRADVLRRAAPLKNVLGNDWLLVAAVAFQGRIRTLDRVRIYRTAGDTTSGSIESIVATFGLPRFHARIPILVMAWHAFADIAWRADVYCSLGRGRRLAAALPVVPAVFTWRALAWHLTGPPVERLGRRIRRRTSLGRSQ